MPEWMLSIALHVNFLMLDLQGKAAMSGRLFILSHKRNHARTTIGVIMTSYDKILKKIGVS